MTRYCLPINLWVPGKPRWFSHAWDEEPIRSTLARLINFIAVVGPEPITRSPNCWLSAAKVR